MLCYHVCMVCMVCWYVCMYVCMPECMYVCLHVCMYGMLICMYACMYVCMYECMFCMIWYGMVCMYFCYVMLCMYIFLGQRWMWWTMKIWQCDARSKARGSSQTQNHRGCEPRRCLWDQADHKSGEQTFGHPLCWWSELTLKSICMDPLNKCVGHIWFCSMDRKTCTRWDVRL